MPASPPSPLLMVTGAVLVSAMVGAWIWALNGIASGRPLLPRRPIAPVSWGGATVLLMIILWLIIQGVVAGILLDVAGEGRLKPSPEALMTFVSVANTATLVALPLSLWGIAGARPAHFGLGPGAESVADLARGAVAGMILAPLVYAVGFVAVQVWPPRRHPLEEMIRADPSGRAALLTLLSAVLLAPAVEELLFRGILQGWLVRLWSRRQRAPAARPETGADEPAPLAGDVPADAPTPDPDRSPWAAPTAASRPDGTPSSWAPLMPSLMTSVLFAAIHVSEWPSPIPIFFLSLGLGFLYERTGSLLAPFALHATFNGLSTLFLFAALLAGGPPAGAPVPKTACAGAWSIARRADPGRPPRGSAAHRRIVAGAGANGRFSPCLGRVRPL